MKSSEGVVFKPRLQWELRALLIVGVLGMFSVCAWLFGLGGSPSQQCPTLWATEPVALDVSNKLPRGSTVPYPFVKAKNPHWADNCVICSEFYQFCYLKMAKSASTTMVNSILPALLCTPEANASQITAAGCPPVFSSQCAQNTHKLYLRDDFYVFTIVRDPMIRARSSYYYLRDHTHAEDFPTLDQFCENPAVLHGKHEGSATHWEPQFHHLISSDNTMLPDYVGKVENLAQSLHDIVHGINANLDRVGSHSSRLKLENIRADSHSNPTKHHSDTIDVLPCQCVFSLSKYFWADLDMLRYPLSKCTSALSASEP
eukprot:m.14486 g.14486  ORF g.14486 m.14486 type:complete len:315 (+) comp6326_c0_seq1:535-1479(+)